LITKLRSTILLALSFIANAGARDVWNRYTELLTSPDGVTWTSKKYLASTTSNMVFFGSDIAFKPGATAGTGTYVVAGRVSNAVYTAPENLSSLTRVPLTGLNNSTGGEPLTGGSPAKAMVGKA
jgi:hypothetical protein